MPSIELGASARMRIEHVSYLWPCVVKALSREDTILRLLRLETVGSQLNDLSIRKDCFLCCYTVTSNL